MSVKTELDAPQRRLADWGVVFTGADAHPTFNAPMTSRTRRRVHVVIVAMSVACTAEQNTDLVPPEPTPDPLADGLYQSIATYWPPTSERTEVAAWNDVEDGKFRTCLDDPEVWNVGSIEAGFLVHHLGSYYARYVAAQPSGLVAIASPLSTRVELWEPAPGGSRCAPISDPPDAPQPPPPCDDGEALIPPGTVLESVDSGATDWRRIAIGDTHLVECGPEWRAHAVPYEWKNCDGRSAIEVRLPAPVVAEVELRGSDRVRLSSHGSLVRMQAIDAPEGCGAPP